MSDSDFTYRWGSKRRPAKSKRAERKPTDRTDDETIMATARAQSAPQIDSVYGDFAGTCIHAVNGVELVADAHGVAYWPATETLLVADLHFEKGSSFARRGQLLPPYDTGITLRRLAACLTRWQPRRVVALGDSFHD
ncbi:MAG: hypothetical protein AAFO70_01600, partial [Pseudomonadota bacterium]